MYILQQLYSTNSLSTACLGQVIIKIMQLKILLRVQWTRLVVRGLKTYSRQKPEGQRPVGRLKRKWEDNIKIDLQEVVFGRMD